MNILTRIEPIWRRQGATQDPAIFANEMERRYREPHRRHHTLNHLAQGWEVIDQLPPGLIQSSDELEVAWIGHDSVFEVIDGVYQLNEINSGQLIVEMLLQAGLSDQFVRSVYDQIIRTDHKTVPETNDQRLIVDLDLFQLAVPAVDFDINYRSIREEFAQAPEKLFNVRTASFFQQMLDRQRVYYTDYFFRRCEARARENLDRRLRTLKIMLEN